MTNKRAMRAYARGIMITRWKIAALLVSTGLTACQSTGAPGPEVAAAPEIAPPLFTYRQLIAQEMKSSRWYARGIRDAEISSPAVAWGGLINGGRVATVCIRYKTQGALLLGYGQAAKVFFFPNGRMSAESGDVSAPGWYALSCSGDRTYTPFPEIEHKV
jgi:hypothetical protein